MPTYELADGSMYTTQGTNTNTSTTNNGKINAQGIASALGGAASAFGTAYSTYADVQSPDYWVQRANAFQVDPNYGGSSLDSWEQAFLNNKPLSHLKLSDVGYNTGKGIMNTLGAGVQGAGAGAAFGPWGALAGGVLGTIGGLFGMGAAKRKANRTVDIGNKAIDYTNDFNIASLHNSLGNITKNMNINAVRNAAFGGPLNMSGDGVLSPFGSRFSIGGPMHSYGADWTNGIKIIGEGGTHEENPYEGVQMGIDPQGVPNLVEEGEVIWNDYVFSNRMKVPKRDRIKYKLTGPKNLTYAEAAKKAQKESEERPNDPISKRGLEEAMARLADSQEEQRQKEFMRELEKQAKELGMTPEELLYAMQQQQQQPMTAAYGGKLKSSKKFSKGGNALGSQYTAWVHNLDDNAYTDLLTKIYGSNIPSLYKTDRQALIDYANKGKPGRVYNGIVNNYAKPFTDDEWKWFTGLDRQSQLNHVFAPYVSDFNPEDEKARTVWQNYGLEDKDFYTNDWGEYWNFNTVNSIKDAYNKKDYMGWEQFLHPTQWTGPRQWGKNDPPGIAFYDPDKVVTNMNSGLGPDIYGIPSSTDSGLQSLGQKGLMERMAEQRGLEFPNGTPNTFFELNGSSARRKTKKVTKQNPITGVYETTEELVPGSEYTNYLGSSVVNGPDYDWFTGLRYAPILSSAISGIRNLLTPADYSRANDVERAYSNINDVKVTPKYNYMQYRPIDRMMMANMIGQQAAATRRNIMNTSGGNRGTAVAGLLASDNQYLNKLGEAFIAGDAENYKRYAQTLDTNNKINQWLGQLDLGVQEANQRAAEARARGVQLSRGMMDAIDAQRAAAISNDWTNVAQGLGDIGWEQFNRNMVNTSNPIYGIGEDGNVYFKGGERAESLMKKHLSADDYKAWKSAKVNSDEYAQLLSKAFVNMQRNKTYSRGGYLTIKGRRK